MGKLRWVECPWCHRSNDRVQLQLRGDKCRNCNRDVEWGINYLKAKSRKQKARVRREAKIKQIDVVTKTSSKMLAKLAALRHRVPSLWMQIDNALGAKNAKLIGTLAGRMVLVERHIARLEKKLAETQPVVGTPSSASRAIVLPEANR